jgi:hypothetical protein
MGQVAQLPQKGGMMRAHTKIALLTATMSLGAAPALAFGPPSGTPIPTNTGTAHMPATPGSQGSQGTANTPANPGSQGGQGTANAPTNPGSQGTSHKPSTPGPNASLPAKAKAYGKLCQTESKTHVAGTPGTPFSKCVTDMAKVANGSSKNPRTACKDESKQHVTGQRGTPFSQCVSAAAKLLKNQAAGSSSSSSSSGS